LFFVFRLNKAEFKNLRIFIRLKLEGGLKVKKVMIIPDFSREEKLIKKGYKYIAGVDEAGRGPLAGPVVASAVIIPPGAPLFKELITDSKKMSEASRLEAFKLIKEHYMVGVAIVDHETIDKINILQATFLAMRRAIAKLEITPTKCLIDGNKKIPNLKLEQEAIIKGDLKVYVISAASIVAKVTRDKLMYKYHKFYPEYNFAAHKGYGTPEHLAALQKHGRSPIHRLSFSYPGSTQQLDLISGYAVK